MKDSAIEVHAVCIVSSANDVDDCKRVKTGDLMLVSNSTEAELLLIEMKRAGRNDKVTVFLFKGDDDTLEHADLESSVPVFDTNLYISNTLWVLIRRTGLFSIEKTCRACTSQSDITSDIIVLSQRQA